MVLLTFYWCELQSKELLVLIGVRGLESQKASTWHHAMEIQNLTSSMQVRNVEANLDRSLVDANGNPLHRCIVMQRGESLDLWVGRAT
jgi:hypothetical protein